MVSSKGMLVKGGSMSNLPMKLLEPCSTVSETKLNEPLTVYLLVVKIDTKNFASLYADVCKAEKIGLEGGKPPTHFLCTLQAGTMHYSRFSSYWLRMSLCFFGQALRVKNLFINFTDALFLTSNKIQELVTFYSHFLKFALIT